MNDEELIEEMAHRLAEVVLPVEGIAGLADYEDACDLARAKEVLGWLEWARRYPGDGAAVLLSGALNQDVSACRAMINAGPFAPLSLPPKGWKP